MTKRHEMCAAITDRKPCDGMGVTTAAWLAVRAVVVVLATLQVIHWLHGTPPAHLTWSLVGKHGHPPFAECDDGSQTCVTYEVTDVLAHTQSDLQTGMVFETEFFGRVMLLDSEVMITQRDEAHYHEMLAHVPLAYLPHARRVLLIGGGDGGTLKQVLQHKNVEQVVMVEIDSMVVQMSKDYFPELGQAYSDPRVDLKFMDGGEYVKTRVAAIKAGTEQTYEDAGPFDAILLDTTDFGIAVSLFQSTFYADLRLLLQPAEEGGGILAFNVDSPSWTLHVLQLVADQLTGLYKHVSFYQTWQPTYSSGHYAFVMASDTVQAFRTPVDWAAFEAKEMNLTYYNPDLHVASFLLPSFARQGLPSAVGVSLQDYIDTMALPDACAVGDGVDTVADTDQ